jgi:hypothetical protein
MKSRATEELYLAIVEDDVGRVYEKIDEGGSQRGWGRRGACHGACVERRRVGASLQPGRSPRPSFPPPNPGADVNFVFGPAYKCPEGYTPLMVACHRGR